MRYGVKKRSLKQLQDSGLLRWPETLLAAAKNASVLDKLLDSHNAFLRVCAGEAFDHNSWPQGINSQTIIAPNLFLKHLMALTDIGGEALNKLTPIMKYFPTGAINLEAGGGSRRSYKFQKIHNITSLHNTALGVSSSQLLAEKKKLDLKGLDVVMLLMFGGLDSESELTPELAEIFSVGRFIGNKMLLVDYVQSAYLRVSRQTGGATANSLGASVQSYVAHEIRQRLPIWDVKETAVVPGVQHGNTPTTFDVLAESPKGNKVCIEVSFQVTTNSVIERKARESAAVYESCRKAGALLVYVIDGAGNLNVRTKAVQQLIDNSDLVVTISPSDLDLLADELASADMI
jgi:hypothetical protein